jgi:hypothetical protein
LFLIGIGINATIIYSLETKTFDLLYLGVCLIIFGIFFLWKEVIQGIKPLKTTIQNTIDVCPFCGAVNYKNAIFCEKCKRQINK